MKLFLSSCTAITVFVCLISIEGRCSNEEKVKYQACDFLSFNDLSPLQQQLLEPTLAAWKESPYFLANAVFDRVRSTLMAGIRVGTEELGESRSDDAIFRSWVIQNNDLAASFIGLTHALSVVSFKVEPLGPTAAIHFLHSITVIKGDRIFAKLDRQRFAEWMKEGARFKIDSPTGYTEAGTFSFDAGDAGGSLHSGFEMQGYTSVSKVPRLQLQYRRSDSESDIDLDGYRPWVGNFLPNPRHLTYENSDIRAWFKSYFRKFGDPGFRVKVITDKPNRDAFQKQTGPSSQVAL